ncbi:hypothetical protein [Streptomyces sp. NPDC055210]
MPSRTFLALAGWTAAAVAATLTGLAAVEIIGDGITGSSDGRALSSEQVEQQLDAAQSSSSTGPGGGSDTATPSATPDTGEHTSTPTSSATPVPTATVDGVQKTFSAPGGTAIATCQGGTVRLLSWAPAQGYGVKSADPGPDDEHADVKFEGAAGKAELRVRCVDGRPIGSWKQDD